MMCGVSLSNTEQIKWHLAEVLGQPGVIANMSVSRECVRRSSCGADSGYRDYHLTVSLPVKPHPPKPYKPSADDPVFLEAVRAAVAKIAEPDDDEDDEDELDGDWFA